MPDAPPTAVSHAHALCVYAEPLVQGRRVLVIDDASHGVGARLVGLGARIVHVYDPDGHRARESAPGAARGLTVQELPVGDFDVRDGAFDVAILPDLGLVVEPAALLVRVRRLLGPEGVALVCCHNAEARPRGDQGGLAAAGSRAVDYYELFDLVALQFAHVRMVGLVPFVGVALAELGLQGEPEVSVDTQLAGDADPPELFIALGSQNDTRLAEYAIVQLAAPALPAARAESREMARERVALAEAQLRASVLAAQLEHANTRAATAQEADRERRALELEATLAVSRAQLREAQGHAAEHEARAGQLAEQARRQGEELLAERHHRARVEAELGALRRSPDAADARQRADALVLSLRAAEELIVTLRDRLDAAQARVALGEEQIAALATSLDDARSVEPDPAQLARLTELAERTADAEARAAEMEAELDTIAEANAGELVELETALRERGKALKELEHEVLRRERLVQELVAALEEQEHVRAAGETHLSAAGADATAGRELQIARAEIETMRRELEARTGAAAHSAGQLDRLRAENEALRAKLDALALEAARREGEITTRGWRITELEQLVAAQTPVAGGKSAGDPAVVARLQDELDALRQALTQEHAARTRSESGEELAKARAELARQAALIEQLSRELDGPDRPRARESSSPL
jgi:hypothetical protein